MVANILLSMYYNTVALIPARMGSKRIPLKNIRTLGGHPLIAYAIQSAFDSGLFGGVFVSSDSDRIGEIAEYYGAQFIKRPDEYATDDSPDSEWIEHAFDVIGYHDYFAIIRPTNPFRTGKMIEQAFIIWDKISRMKSIKPVTERPEKMWYLSDDGEMHSYNDNSDHLLQSELFKPLFVQSGSIEFRQRYEMHICYQPFFNQDYEGHDLNFEYDWILAEALIERGYAKLPQIDRSPYDFGTV